MFSISNSSEVPVMGIETISGYNGSDIIVIDSKAATIIYSLNNKLVKEQIRSRYQQTFSVSNSEITAITRNLGQIAIGNYTG